MGQTESELTENGVKQAKSLGKWMAAVFKKLNNDTLLWPFDFVYCSDLYRTVHTFNLIAEQFTATSTSTPKVTPTLRERGWGVLEGRPMPELHQVAKSKGLTAAQFWVDGAERPEEFKVIELLQAFTGWETNNKYAIKNSMGQQIYYAFEDTDCLMRMCCGPGREFTIHIVDNFAREVMRIFRPLKPCAGCCWLAELCQGLCAQELQVEAPPGNVIGTVVQAASCCTYDYFIRDATGSTQLIIEGPCLACRCCADVEFPVYTADKQHEIGKVTKQWGGLIKEMYTHADNFGITFPLDLDVKTKATLLGAMFLIDFMAFEKQQ